MVTLLMAIPGQGSINNGIMATNGAKAMVSIVDQVKLLVMLLVMV
jgi:hypothetical protein